jgi:hypothetical protein
MALVLALSLTFCCSEALAQFPRFQITAPTVGSVYSPGQVVTIQWTGGDPSWTVLVYIIDSGFNTVVDAASVNGSNVLPNTGTATWIVPSTLGFGGPCGHTYRSYVQNVNPTTAWAYAVVNQFTVVCQVPVAIDIKPGAGALRSLRH